MKEPTRSRSRAQAKVVLVTGGSSGIGFATALEYVRRGAHVWLLARNCERLELALAKLKAASTRPDQCPGILQADVADAQQVFRAIEDVTERAGLPDIVVNSAGITQPGYFQELDLSLFRDMMDVNYFGTLHVCKAVAPGMIARGSGHLVNVASAAAFLPVFGYTAYSASKHAVRGLSQVLRLELKPHGVGVSIVYPPDVDTPQLAWEDEYKPPETRAFNGGVVLPPESVAQAIVKGVALNSFAITPGLEATATRRLTELLGDLQYPILDAIVGRARRKKAAGSKHD